MFGIFWDCDGTIMDTEKSYAYAWKDFLYSKGLELPIEEFDKFVGIDDRIIHKQFSEKVDLDDFQSTMDKLHEIMRVEFSEKILFKDSLNCILKFHGDIFQACVSASPKEVLNFKLQDAKINNYFDYVIGGNEVLRNKPNPDIYLKAIEISGSTKNIIVEDSPTGIQSGKESGSFVIAIDRGIFTKEQISDADVVVDKLDPIEIYSFFEVL
ncbi:MAG: hypothetical protein CL518_00630 [Actinobacteria bacterium]|nr:hypothetical protein [Actinomycetota bacterium]|tara:strand:+ start:2004 stop:2636 length:633 start_codon:yes stop_codon:yes gene_type:complete